MEKFILIGKLPFRSFLHLESVEQQEKSELFNIGNAILHSLFFLPKIGFHKVENNRYVYKMQA